jgi:sugar-specific transcriptional regulator TrmB
MVARTSPRNGSRRPALVSAGRDVGLSTEQVEELAELGLTGYEAKTYVALLRRESSTAAQAARVAKVPRQRVYDVLASLVEKGLAAARPGPVVKYVAEAPGDALNRLLSRRREELQELEQHTESLIETLGPSFVAGREENGSLEYIEVLRDRRAINERFDELRAGIKEEILVFRKPPYATPPQKQLVGLDVSRRFSARSVYELSVFDNPAVARGVRRFVEAGEEARFVPELPLKLVIIDESIVMFGMKDPVAGGSQQTMLVVDHPSLACVLRIAFTALWDQGLTFDQAAAESRFRRRLTA